MKIRKCQVSEKICNILTMQFINKAVYAAILLSMAAPGIASAEDKIYEVPPSSVTSSSAPYISDYKMEQCVRLYNEIKWLGEDIKRKQTNVYTKSSIAVYNDLVDRHSSMVEKFNCDCAGRQSESAYKAAQKLNKENASISNTN